MQHKSNDGSSLFFAEEKLIPQQQDKWQVQVYWETWCTFLWVIFIGPESDHWLPLKLKNSLTNCCLLDLIDVTLVREDANSKLVDVVTVADVADVDAEERVDDTLVEILKWVLYLVFGYKVEAEA